MDKLQCFRRNSLVIDFTVLPVKPSIPEVQKFILDCMKLELGQIANLQILMQESYVFIELIPAITAEDVAKRFNRKFCMITPDGLQKAIPIFLADGTVQIKIYDLPPLLPDEVIVNHLTDYGEVLSIKEESWQDFFPGIPNSTRIARMRLKKPIPSHLQIEGITAFVRYQNQAPTCKHNLHSVIRTTDETSSALPEVAQESDITPAANDPAIIWEEMDFAEDLVIQAMSANQNTQNPATPVPSTSKRTNFPMEENRNKRPARSCSKK